METKSAFLTKAKIEYLHILYAIWMMASYYSRLFGIDPWEDPTKIPVVISEIDGATALRFHFYSVPMDRDYSFREIREIMQQYLDYCILPGDKILRPYAGGTSLYDIVEPLYIDKVGITDEVWQIDIIYIDNPLAFKYVMGQQLNRRTAAILDMPQ